MPTFTLAMSCLTTSNLPWFMDLTFRVPMHYEACGILIPQPRIGRWNLNPWTPREAPACVLSHFSCVLLCDPVDCSPPGSSVHGILQARILECIAMPTSRGSSWPRGWTRLSCFSCLAGGFFTTSATWEAPSLPLISCLPLSYLSPTSYQYSSQINLHSVFASGSFQGQPDFKNASVRVQVTSPGSSDK